VFFLNPFEPLIQVVDLALEECQAGQDEIAVIRIVFVSRLVQVEQYMAGLQIPNCRFQLTSCGTRR